MCDPCGFKSLFTREPHLSNIRTMKKKFDIRLNTKSFKNVKAGWVLRFHNKAGGPEVHRRCTKRWEFESFQETFKSLPLGQLLPGETLQGGLKIMYGFYSKRDEERHKVVVFELEELGNNAEGTTSSTSDMQTPATTLIYQVCCRQHMGSYVFFGRTKNSRDEERLDKKWLTDNYFDNNYRRRCKDNLGKCFMYLVGS